MDSQSWIEHADLLSLFPSHVWTFDLTAEEREKIAHEITPELEAIRPVFSENRTGVGWQSPQDLHRRESLTTLVSIIDDSTRSILRFLKIGYDAFEITGCWANINSPGCSHRMHSHPNNFLSGAYYLQTQAGADTINFHDPRIQAAVIRPPVTELTGSNTDQVVVKVKDGMLLLFPAYLQHSVDANTSDRERISISFNIMFSSFTENLSKPLWSGGV
ncbi:MAG: 2OG-Fe(II) oxygenase family protein [Chromatiales bacterium]|nr:2OG-Fe(II) oxygenase family protein [Chromatiales bacterium]